MNMMPESTVVMATDGWLVWDRYVSLLREVGYEGYFAIERETGDQPVEDIRRAVAFLRSLSG